jgi:hypothetical protein
MVPDGGSAQVFATETYVDTAVSNLVDTAPETLDTLNELAAALGDDANFATTITSSIATKQDASTALTTSTTFGGDVSGTYDAIVVADDSHSHSTYLPLTGGTVTGQTTFSGVDGVKLTGVSGGVWFDDRNGDGSKFVIYHDGSLLGFWNGSTTPFVFHDTGTAEATNWSVGTGSSTNSFSGGSNYWRPQDAYGNSYFDINSGSFYVDAAAYYFRNASSQNRLEINSAGAVIAHVGVDAGYFSKSITNAYANLAAWPADGNWLGLMGGNGYVLIDGAYSDDDIYIRTYTNSGRVNIGAGGSNTLQVDNGAASMNGTLYIQNLLYTSTSNTTGVFMSLADDGWFRDDQNSQIYFRNYANTNWGTMVGIFSNQSTLTSKKDISPLNKVDRQSLLQDMVDMPLYSYKYIGDDDDTPTIYGPIIELAPNYLSRTGTDLWLAPYVGALHATIKELNSKIEELEQRIVSVGG